jgi:hypothetical protein
MMEITSPKIADKQLLRSKPLIPDANETRGSVKCGELNPQDSRGQTFLHEAHRLIGDNIACLDNSFLHVNVS